MRLAARGFKEHSDSEEKDGMSLARSLRQSQSGAQRDDVESFASKRFL